MKSFHTTQTSAGWECMCEECGDGITTPTLARVAPWMYGHVCQTEGSAA